MPLKLLAVTMSILAASALFPIASAQAFDASKSSGMADYNRGIAGPCPAGTCNQKGGPNAKNVKMCSAENCKRKAGK